ncbi:hypothetical protein A3A71_03940 [Candidatus Berkelbacteria bacterium RIFCSPLOWO2_01_FULL_50_28]|uniref:Glycosyltransferase subfamily 4-like N-terminal domain-containing protein n=1 Tax=Candidatus Berkelbacteria bacterium RIFCSPLOWO2_01_FULL_50_28 TaxID=1797471 RepID=A0A1F5EA70_9BACT|nr:MAG: hypothetical protein A3A71_03940 [Candidatus Berkelbacteria bacterium RIFCSPLOWO2_01_FULL_50_28]
MKILVGSLTYPLANGVTTSINTSVDGFVRAGHEIAIVAPRYAMGQVRPEHHPIVASPISRWFLSAMHKKERMFGAAAAGEFADLISRFEPDAFWLHTLTWSENAFERLMKRSKKARVLTYHTMVEEYGRLYAGEAGARVMAHRSKTVANAMNAVITPSKVIAKRLAAYGVKKQIYVIPTGISMPSNNFSRLELAARFHFSPASKILLYVGRVSKEKNITKLLTMCAPVLRQKTAVLLLVGPGDLDEAMADAKSLGVENQVICTGPLPKEDTQRIYGGSDAFVFASQTETQGLVIGEAMLAGTPVVALDSPIQPEVYPDSLAVVVRDENKYAVELEDALANESAKKRFAVKAKKFVEDNFSIKLMLNRQISVFEKLVRSDGSP